MRRSQRTEEQWEDLRHRIIVRAIEDASDTLMERNRSGAESAYWKNTNVVRRNLLMAAVRRSIWMEWDPMGEAYVDNQSLAELRALAFRRLTETVANHIRTNLTPSPSPPHSP